MTLRRAIAVDALAIARIHVAAWRESYAGLLPDTMLAGLSVQRRAVMWQDLLSRPDDHRATRVYLVEQEAGAVGFGAAGGQRSDNLLQAGLDGEISAIYVLRAAQRAGAGSSLMRRMANDLLSRGHHGASLWVLRENRAARAFYEKLGGVIVAERQDTGSDATLHEVAYAWHALASLAQPRALPS